MKKLISIFLIITLCLSTLPATSYAGDASNYFVLSFAPNDAVSNADGTMLYFSSKANKKVYCINTQTFEQKSISFDLMPESMYFKDGRLYVSLCTQNHSSYWEEDDQSGAFAIIDCANFSLTAQYDITIDPYDIVVSKDNFIYITSGSGQWTNFNAYTQDGLLLNTAIIRQMSTIKYNQSLNRIYTITSDLSSRDMTAYSLNSDGTFLNTRGYSWTYGSSNSSTKFEISPDGKYIFNAYGYVLDCGSSQADDMIKNRDMNVSFNDICFESDQNKFYIATSNKYVTSFNYDTFMPIESFTFTIGSPERIFLTANNIIALTKAENSVYCLETVSRGSGIAPNTDNDYGVIFKSEITAAVYSPLMNKTYAIDKGAKELIVFDHALNKIETKTALDCRPDGITLSSDGSKILIVNDSYCYAATELDINTLQKTRNIGYSIPKNYNSLLSHRKIIQGAGKIFIVDGGWEPVMYAFDNQTLEYLGNFGILAGIGGMYIDSQQKYLYTWYQYGWSAGYAGSKLYKYDISGSLALLVNKFEPSDYSTLARDPLDSPIIPFGDNIILKDKIFSTSSLSTYSTKFSETIYAIDTSKGLGVGKNGIYDLDSSSLIQKVNFNGAKYITFDINGNIYFSTNGTIQKYGLADMDFGTDKISMNIDDTRQIKVDGTYTDGIKSDVTSKCTFVSSNPSAISVDNNGLISAVKTGAAKITVSCDGFEKSMVVGVNVDINSLSVNGYNIDFSTSNTNYIVPVPEGSADIPAVTYEASSDFSVAVNEAANLPGTTTVTVSDPDGLISKTYTLKFVTVKSITISYPANKLEYLVGTPLDISGLEILGYCSDGNYINLPISKEDISGFDSSKAVNDQVLTISAYGKTTTYTVNIVGLKYIVSGTVLSAANLFNSNDYYVNFEMNTAWQTVVTLKPSFLSETIIAEQVVNPITKSFVFTDIPNGSYVLEIKRAGYLSRYVNVTVNGGDVILPDKSLLAGDLNGDHMIDGSDTGILFSLLGKMYGYPKYNPLYDIYGDAQIDGSDTGKVFPNLGKDVYSYGENVDFKK